MSKRDPGLSWMRCFYNVQQGSVAPCGWHYIGLGQMNMFVIFHWDTRWCSTSTAFISLSVSWLVYCFHSRAWTWYHRHHCYSCLSFCTHKRSVLFNSLLTTNSFPLSLCMCVCLAISHLVQGTNQLRQVLRVVESRGSQNVRKVRGHWIRQRT